MYDERSPDLRVSYGANLLSISWTTSVTDRQTDGRCCDSNSGILRRALISLESDPNNSEDDFMFNANIVQQYNKSPHILGLNAG